MKEENQMGTKTNAGGGDNGIEFVEKAEVEKGKRLDL